MPLKTRAGVPPGEEGRYREFAIRQERIQEVKEEEGPLTHPYETPPADVLSRVERDKHGFRRHQIVLAGFLAVILVVFLGLVWRTRPVVDPIRQDPGQIEWAKKLGLPVEITNSLGMRLRLIPPGAFVMGSPSEELGHRSDENQHQADIPRPFYMAVTEITQDVYERVMQTNTSFFLGGPDYPIDSVLWDEAIKFCNRLSKQEGLPDAYERMGSGWVCYVERAGYRMPVEAEWEFACRAGTLTILYGGAAESMPRAKLILRKIAWFHDTSGGQPHTVGELTPNQWGLYDMIGNVREWCWDYYDIYPATYKRRFLGPWSGDGRVVRGGCWFADVEQARSASRRRWPEDLRWNAVGFRVVRTAEAKGGNALN